MQILPLLFVSLISVFSSLSLVSAHGYLAQLIINGKAYPGNVPGATPTSSVIRQVSDISPVKGATNPDLNCGLSAQFAADVADANPGDAFQFDWRGGDDQNWPHNTGPMLTYMTSCGSSSCTTYNSSTSKWFKIQQVARISSGGPWAQEAVMEGFPANVTLPSKLAPGNYLIRHEILGLQGAVSVGGAEFYPACSQLKVGGSQTGGPTDDELVLLPGAYSDTDPGIYDPNVYDPSASYTFPGPPVAAFAGGDASGTSVSGDASASVSAAGSSSTGATGTGSSSSSSSPSNAQSVCKLQRKTTSLTSDDNSDSSLFITNSKTRTHKRRHTILSGLFRDLALVYRGS
ncbi:glycoside hydrolase family 61 protein [Lentinula raphanica]|uniref:lytic cellulose monooxygenase (C4-dehydrogenating) n=1 Tax=Lentinula raphanica TaxID=153919 RepID=A0AA38UL98_9AGAR|nr:glycoside hydrolase family 61 protein [Lentinula raphanica]KAJ3845384.1 glycoside hydrolase family 61 protein [Lentinula raphanica]KAJ3971875.1 glycoside hydrolase family 61 protein [Lentinula raphanica]